MLTIFVITNNYYIKCDHICNVTPFRRKLFAGHCMKCHSESDTYGESEMFKRWLGLLTALLVIEAVTVAYLSNQISKTIDDGCMEYLDSLPNPDDWEPKNDSYFLTTCDYDNPVSVASRNIVYQDFLNSLIGKVVAAFIVTLGMLLVSLVARWVYKGRLR